MKLILCMLLIAPIFALPATSGSDDGYKLNEEKLVGRLLNYLRIDTITQTSNSQTWESALHFWEGEARQLGLDYKVYYPKTKPVVVMSLPGARPELPSVVMNSHMDVVPVQDQDMWSNSPFGPQLTPNGQIIARGAQDCKSLAIQQLEAFRYYRETFTVPLRTLHMTLMPDEETGGFEGMQAFVETEQFRQLRAGLVLDEGLSLDDDNFYATYVDKRPWQMRFNIRGSNAGHGAVLHQGTAVEQMTGFLNEVLAFRKEQLNIAKSVDKLDYGAFTSVNINVIKAGVATNVVPSSVQVVVDMRLSSHANVTEMQAMVDGWLLEHAGANSSLQFERQLLQSHASAVDDSNPFWLAMRNFSANMNKQLKPIVCPATSDMSYVRGRGVPALGFSPNTNTVTRMHSTDEYITTDTFLRGARYYVELIKTVTAVPCDETRLR